MEGTAIYVPVIGYLCETLRDSEFMLVDIGCSGGIDSIWRGFGARLRALGIDPNIVEIERLQRAETYPGIRYLAALAALPASHPFARKKDGRPYWSRNPWERLSVKKSLEIMRSAGQMSSDEMTAANFWESMRLSEDVIVVPEHLQRGGIYSVDFLKIDVDGADFDILNSFDRALDSLAVLGVRIEVTYFGSASDTDNTFHNVDRFMKERGFELFGMTVRHYSAASLPSRYVWKLPAESEFGRPLLGDALYIRDLGSSDYDPLTARLPVAKLVNLICIFAAFNLPDCGAEIAVRFRDRLSPYCDVDRVLDLLTAQAQGHTEPPLTYREYIRRFEEYDPMFFTQDAQSPIANTQAAEQSSREGDAILSLNSAPRPPSVAIIVRVMDRADEFRVSLPSLLNQDYPDYQVIVVDHCSQDGLTDILESAKSPRLHVVRCPRPSFFNPSVSGNTGVRYSFSDLLFLWDTGMTFRDEHQLSEIVASFEGNPEIDERYFERWRAGSGYASLNEARLAQEEAGRRVYCECECHGLHTLIERDIFQRIGGLNEALLDWGYEDTDLSIRLELCGYGRIPIRELNHGNHPDDLRVRFFEVKSKEQSWTKNRLISDGFIRTFGPFLRTQRNPGLCEWVEIDGVRFDGASAPQQKWTMPTAGELPSAADRSPSPTLDRKRMPLVSVVVPTKNAAEYLVEVLDSIFSQDYPYIECLVADGGSTDATLDILASYGDRLTLMRQADNGPFDGINRAWQASRGEILTWLNAADSWPPRTVSTAVQYFIDDPAADVIYGDYLAIDPEGWAFETRRPPDWDLAYGVEACDKIIEQPGAFVRRDAAERVGWLDRGWFYDLDFWRRISLTGGKMRRVNHLLGGQRVGRVNRQPSPEILVRSLVGVTKKFFELEGVPPRIQRLRRRALSNCYLKIAQILEDGTPENRALRLRLRLQALAANPSNLFNIGKTTPIARRPLPASAPEEGTLEEPPLLGEGSFFRTLSASQEPSGSRQTSDSSLPDSRVTVSVVVPCKNDARYLPYALDSILSQDYANLECIVVDGGSRDGTLRVLERYGDLIRWVSEPDRGSFDAINRGWKLSHGEILTWLNADDLWAPGAVRTALEVFEGKPEVDVVFGTAAMVDERGRVHFDMVPEDWDLEYALLNCLHIIYQPASFMRRRILEKVGWLYPAWCHDHDLWLRIARAGGKFEKIPDRLAMDRMRRETLGRVAELVVPAKIGLTKRFFADPELPPNLQRLRRRSISNAYIRSVDYVEVERPRHWIMAGRLLAQATIADPLNIRAISERTTRPFRYYGGELLKRLPSWEFGDVRRFAAIPRRWLRHLGSLVAAPRRLLGRPVERVFDRGTRELARKIEYLQQQSEATVISRIDHVAADLQQLTDSMQSLRHQHDERITAVERTMTETLQPIMARIEDRLTQDRGAVATALESLRHQHDERIAAVERTMTETLQPIMARIEDRLTQDRGAVATALESLQRQHEERIAAVERTTAESLDRIAAGFDDRIAQDRAAVETALASLQHQYETLLKELGTTQERAPTLSDALGEVYGTPPTLRPIPGWHTYWGLENGSNGFLRERANLWSSLKRPVLMRWLGDLLVMIWPDNELSRVLFLTGNFEPNELTWVSQALTEGMTMIDIGAHMGMYTLTASKLVGKSGIVIALEPSDREYRRLMFHANLNDLRNVRCLQVAASSACGEGALKIASEWNSGHNTFGEFFNPEVTVIREERVSMQTVDAIVSAQQLERVDLIKIDVEGHELQALAGAAETLRRFRPRILIEVFEETLRRQGASVDEVLGFLTGQDYILYEFSDINGGLVPVSSSPGDESRNLVALPT